MGMPLRSSLYLITEQLWSVHGTTELFIPAPRHPLVGEPQWLRAVSGEWAAVTYYEQS